MRHTRLVLFAPTATRPPAPSPIPTVTVIEKVLQPTAESGIQWGDIATWVASILTGLSLLLGFYIVLRDRRKEEEAHASQLVGWLDMFGSVVPHKTPKGERFFMCRVVIHNASNMPIMVPEALFTRLTPRKARAVVGPRAVAEHMVGENAERVSESGGSSFWTNDARDLVEVLQAGEHTETRLRTPLPIDFYEVLVAFADGSGCRWYRDVRSGSLRREKYSGMYSGVPIGRRWKRAVRNFRHKGRDKASQTST